jgi:hypothetical protein
MFKLHPFLALAVVCVACGPSFSAREGSGGSGSGGSGEAGEASGGEPNNAGSSNTGDAGEMNVAGSGSAGEGSTAGAGGSGAGGSGNGGSGNGGSGNGGSGNGGGWSGGECATLRQEYQTAVEKARVCDKGSTDQCSASSVAQPINCGCPVLVNAKSEYTVAAKKAYQAYHDAKCDSGGIDCAQVFCPPAMGAACAPQSMSPGNAFLCTAPIAIQN